MTELQRRTATTDEQWACLRKRRYRRRSGATKAARAAQRSYGRMHVYRCRYCTGYHVGHPPTRYDAPAGASPAGSRG